MAKKVPLEEYIKQANIIHNNKYSYEKFVYKVNRTKGIIICPEHGEFECSMGHHIQGRKCIKCTHNQFALERKLCNEEFINKVKLVHGNKYDYSKIEYVNGKQKVIILCKKHGEFLQSPMKHSHGRGCPKCKSSHGENSIILYLKSKNIIYETQKWFKDCRNILPLPFDFYLPDYNLLIEYQGLQHFKEYSRFKSHNLKERQRLDAIKKFYALSNGFNFLEITCKQNIEKELTAYLINCHEKAKIYYKST